MSIYFERDYQGKLIKETYFDILGVKIGEKKFH